MPFAAPAIKMTKDHRDHTATINAITRHKCKDEHENISDKTDEEKDVTTILQTYQGHTAQHSKATNYINAQTETCTT